MPLNPDCLIDLTSLISFFHHRFSKRPLRGPYGQMLEAEMKKPSKTNYDGLLEQLKRSER